MNQPGNTNPIPFVGAQTGACADGICLAFTSYRQEIYRGTGPGERDAAYYNGRRWDPFDCTGADYEGEMSCDSGEPNGPHSLNDWRAREGIVYAQPGLQIYEDPDPQGSPLDPLVEIQKALGIYKGGTPLYPLPGIYVGTCGVIIRGGVVMYNPAEKC